MDAGLTPSGPETPQCTPPPEAPVFPGRPKRKSPERYVPPPTPWENPAQKEKREKNVIATCSRARPVVKKLFDGSNTQNKATVDMDTSQVTLLTCFYVQQYYNPSHQEIIAEKESTDVAALGCIFVACKVADNPRRIKNVVRAYNQILQEEKKPELSEEQQHQLVEKMLKIEFQVLRAVTFHFDVLMPLEFLDLQTDRLVDGLFSNSEFSSAYPYDRKALRKQLYSTGMKFCVDGYSGNPALSKCVENLSMASLVFATRFLLRSRTTSTSLPKVCEALDQMPDLVSFMVEGACATEEQQQKVNQAIEGIMQVFKQRKKG